MNALSLTATRRNVLRLVAIAAAAPLAAGLAFAQPAGAASLTPVEMWKSPTCGCCGRWAQYMRQAGFSLTVHGTDDMEAVKEARGVPVGLRACHTAVVNGYVVEGHVPAPDIVRLIAEHPTAKGLAVPGMPAAAPGMDQPGQTYASVLFGTPDGDRPYAQH